MQSPADVLNSEFQTLILNKESEPDDDIILTTKNLEIYIHLQLSSNTAFGLTPVLSDLQPQYIIIYDMNLRSIREIERRRF
mgnify:CR=1 FL=1